jgi:aspartyl-tRNA(Asn)/glutamyl-tRNA(Gln) amidotransferase subunit A
MKDLYKLTIKEAEKLLNSGEISSLQLTESVLSRIEEMEPSINAFISITKEKALEDAKQSDERRKSGELLSRIDGIPYSIKDTYCTKGIQSTGGSAILKGYVPQYNATVYQKLEDAGAVMVGKTNCDPFGFGGSTEYSAYGVTKNPIDTTRVPGGSSGGSGAAVAYGGGLFSIGEDTGGSIRCPASFCGITGLKVTYGRVSRYGSMAYASSYDTVGPMAKNVEDAAIIMEIIAGKDEYDATTSEELVPEYSKLLNESLEGRTIGIPKEYFGEGLDEEVRRVINEAIEKYKSLGCEIKEISLPYTKYAIATYYLVGLSEASSNLGRLDGIRYGNRAEGSDWREIIKNSKGAGFSQEEKRRVMIGTYALSAGYADQFYKKAQKVRALLKKDLNRALEEVDVVLTPTMPMPAFKIGENSSDPLKMWLADAFTVSLNPTGLPGLSVNAGYTTEGLPVGMQLIGKYFREDSLFNFAHQFELSK